MNRDNILFTIVGLLTGFIVGYFVAGSNRARTAAPAAASSAPAASAATASISTSPELLQRVSDLKTALDREPENADLQKQLGDAYYDMNDWGKAAEWYEKALQKKSADANVITDLGSCYRNLGKFSQAVDEYEKAQKVDPTHVQSLLNLTLVYTFDLKDPDKAQATLDRLKKEHPDVPHLSELQTQISALRASKS
jgi:tetratricopeptide (TPR) repeat protein